MHENEQFLRPLESIFASGEYRDFKEFLETNGVKADPSMQVEDVSHGGGRVGKVYKVYNFAIKIARQVINEADIKRERAIYLRLKDVAHIVKMRFAPEKATYLALDFVQGAHPSEFFLQKSLESRLARQQRVAVLKTLREALEAAMKKGLFINDIDLTSNCIVSEDVTHEVDTTIIDVGDAVDVVEIKQKFEKILEQYKIDLEKEQQKLKSLESVLAEKKRKLIELVQSIPKSQKSRSDIRLTINTIRDESIKNEVLKLIEPEPPTPPTRQNPSNSIVSTLQSFFRNEPIPPTTPYFSTISLYDSIRDINLIRPKDVSEAKNKIQQSQSVLSSLEHLVENLAEKPEEVVTLIANFFIAEKKRQNELTSNNQIVFPELSRLEIEFSLKQGQQLRDFAKDFCELVLELLTKDFQRVASFDHRKQAELAENNFKLPHELITIMKKGLNEELKDPHEVIQLITSELTEPKMKAYIEAGNEIEFFRVTDTIGEPKEQRFRRYVAANEYFYDTLEAKPEWSATEEEVLVRTTVEMLIGQSSLPTHSDSLRSALTTTGMWYSSTESVANNLAQLLTSRTLLEKGVLVRKMQELFSSITMSLPKDGVGGHRYFDFKTKEGLERDRLAWEKQKAS